MNKNLNGNKMLYHTDRIFGEHKPITADIFLTNYCNNNCPYCVYKRWKFDADAKAMTFEEFKKYAERLIELGALGFILTGGGEPTICPDFKKITEWLETNNIHYGINTNFNKLYFIKPDYLKVSLDGYDSESYIKARGVDKYEKVLENIKKYSEWKKENSPKTSLGIQYVATSCEDVLNFYKKNKQLEVDYMVFRPYESTAGEYYKGTQNKNEAKQIVNTIKELKEKDDRVVLNFKWNLLDYSQKKCTAQWTQIAINEFGRVLYCCHKPYEIVGNIMDEDILEKKAKAITNMSKCDIPCRLTAPSISIKQVMEGRVNSQFI